MIACNDYILLECAIYRILKIHFGGHAAYTQLLDLFHDVRRPPAGAAACLLGLLPACWGRCLADGAPSSAGRPHLQPLAHHAHLHPLPPHPRRSPARRATGSCWT
jgi:hypothetical protein